MGRYGRAIQREIEKREAAQRANQQLMASLFLPMKLKREEGALNRQAKMRELAIRYANERKQQEYLADQSMQREILKSQTALAVEAMGGEGEGEKPVTPPTQLSFTKHFAKVYAYTPEQQATLDKLERIEDWTGLTETQKEAKAYKEEYPILSHEYGKFEKTGNWLFPSNPIEDPNVYLSAMGIQKGELIAANKAKVRQEIAREMSKQFPAATAGMSDIEFGRATGQFDLIVEQKVAEWEAEMKGANVDPEIIELLRIAKELGVEVE